MKVTDSHQPLALVGRPDDGDSARLDPLDSANTLVRKLWLKAKTALQHGKLEAAAGYLDEAHACAAKSDAALADRLQCGRAALRMELSGECDVSELRAILMRSSIPIIRYLAAYQLALWFDLGRQYKKGRFYARSALEQAHLLARPDKLANAYNLNANLEMADSRFTEAMSHYQSALAVHDRDDDVWSAVIRGNVGYCETVCDRPRQGLKHLYSSLRQLRASGAERYQISCLLDLSFALITAKRPALGIRHAQRALELAEKFDDEASTHNALHLIGSAAVQLGRTFEARRAFERLAKAKLQPDLVDVLMISDTLPLLNLKA